MPTLMQKIRLALRGWNRRREERDREFLARNLHGGETAPPGAAALHSAAVHAAIDIEGLTVAHLDGSGRTAYYLDTQTGDVVEGAQTDTTRFKAIPAASPDADRAAFLASLENSGDRAKLSSAETFRSVLAKDRALEKAWYNFRNDRAIATIETWLRELGLK